MQQGHAKAGTSNWIFVWTTNKAGEDRRTWIDLSTGALETQDSGHTVRVVPLMDSRFRISCLFGSGSETPVVGVFMASGDNVQSYAAQTVETVLVWGLQLEVDANFESSYIPGNETTRSEDNIYWPYPARPQQETLYVRFMELGSALTGEASRVVQIGAANESGARIYLAAQTAEARSESLFNNGVSSVGSSIAGAVNNVAIGDRVELRYVLFHEGAIQLHQLLNEEPEVSAAKSGGQAMPSMWGAELPWFNSVGSLFTGFNGFQSVKIARGVQSLDFMRTF